MLILYAHLRAVVRPGTEFHLAALIVKGKPGNVYLASALEYTGRYVHAGPIVLYDDVRWVSAVEALVGAVTVTLTFRYRNAARDVDLA